MGPGPLLSPCLRVEFIRPRHLRTLAEDPGRADAAPFRIEARNDPVDRFAFGGKNVIFAYALEIAAPPQRVQDLAFQRAEVQLSSAHMKPVSLIGKRLAAGNIDEIDPAPLDQDMRLFGKVPGNGAQFLGGTFGSSRLIVDSVAISFVRLC